MTNRAHPGHLRRELRFSRSLIESNLRLHGTSMDSVKPLLEAFMVSDGLLNLYGSELLLAEKALGLTGGALAVDLVGELVSVKRVPANTGVSYGYLAKTTEETNLGLVAIGFSDGIPRAASNAVSVSIDGHLFPNIGRIAMDQFVLNLGNSAPSPGAEVSFFHENFGLQDWAKLAGFKPLEILGRITERVDRVWSA